MGQQAGRQPHVDSIRLARRGQGLVSGGPDESGAGEPGAREARDPNIKHRWVYESRNHRNVFRTIEDGNKWLEENDPEGVLWRERVIEEDDPDPPSLEDTCGFDVTGIQRATGKNKR
jgi:hypothetical protein